MFSIEYRRRLYEADRRWRIKAVLRTVAAIFSLIGIGIFAAVIPIWDRYFYWGIPPNSGDWQDGFPLGVLVFAFLWNNVALLLLLKPSLHVKPFIPLIVDLLVWAALVPAITWSAGLGMFLDWTWIVEETVEPFLWHLLHKIGHLEIAGVVFACFVWALHVALFIIACIDTHKWRKGRKAAAPSARGLDHGEYAQETEFYAPPPKYEERSTGGIEMHPTSPTAREFV